MPFIAQLLIGLVAILHLGFWVLEALLWDKPAGRKIFGTSESYATASKAMAANQGLYNGFLAAGLIWSLWPIGAEGAGKAIATFFLACVIVAGIVGAMTVSRRILQVQAAPAVVAMLCVWFLPV